MKYLLLIVSCLVLLTSINTKAQSKKELICADTFWISVGDKLLSPDIILDNFFIDYQYLGRYYNPEYKKDTIDAFLQLKTVIMDVVNDSIIVTYLDKQEVDSILLRFKEISTFIRAKQNYPWGFAHWLSSNITPPNKNHSLTFLYNKKKLQMFRSVFRSVGSRQIINEDSVLTLYVSDDINIRDWKFTKDFRKILKEYKKKKIRYPIE